MSERVDLRPIKDNIRRLKKVLCGDGLGLARISVYASDADDLITAVEAAIEERRLREVMCACDPDDIEAMRKCATDLGHAIAAHTAALAPFRESGQ